MPADRKRIDQADFDGHGLGDECDPDGDNDGVADACDRVGTRRMPFSGADWLDHIV